MSLTAGTRLGVYEITGLLGSGGMGLVYRARDSRLRRDVAIKILSHHVAGDPNRLARFEREAQVLASLNHPHIGAIYGIEDSPSGPALILELVEGETLADRIERKALELVEALTIARQVAGAIETAHQRGIIHRDLKPANIKIASDGTVKVLDFGLAKVVENGNAEPDETQAGTHLTRDGAMVGTIAYMSPEQVRGKDVDKRTDIWAFGCVVFEMLAGRTPFAAATLADTVAAILEREPDWRVLPETTPAPLVRLLRHCLEKASTLRLRDIGDARLDIDDAHGGRTPRPEGTSTTPGHNLPAELTSFVGRRKELAELSRALAASRLLSLIGAGGAGKTRLALRLAADVINQFRHGVWLIELAPVTSADLVAQTIASALGIRESPPRTLRESLIEYLRRRELVLLLDNCEHLIEPCAQIAEVLLRQAPSLRIIATSREALGVPGETIRRVASLSLPDAPAAPAPEALLESDATRLFLERAACIDHAFTATPDNAPVIARICARLDGIPLAIELAAARIAALSIEQIDERLQDRFRLLTGNSRTAVARQRTLEATMHWSYQLLSDVERQLLCRVSVFPGSWTLEAAERVCGGEGIERADMLDLVSRLVSKSLVTLDSDAAGARRYRMLETVRQYARERLVDSGEGDRLREQHLEFFVDQFRGFLPVLQGAGQLHGLKRLRAERDNVRAALDWALESAADAEKALELAGAIFWYWTKRGEFAEGRQWLERALASAAPRRSRWRGRALVGLAHMMYFQGHFDGLAECNAEAVACGREHGDSWVITFALFGQALAEFDAGDPAVAARLAQDARDAARTDEDSVAGPLLILANLAAFRGEFDLAQRLFDESNSVNRRVGEIWGLGIGLLAAAGLRIAREDFAAARAHIGEALSINEQLDDPRGIAWSFEVLAGLLGAEGQADAAARLWAISDRLLESVGGALLPFIKWMRDRYMGPARAALGGAAFDTAAAQGRAMSTADAITLARRHASPQ